MSMRDEIKVRCTAEQKARWQEAAGESGLSEWLRELADAASVQRGLEKLFAEDESGRSQKPIGPTPPPPPSGDTLRPALRPACPHGRPTFVFCPRCLGPRA